MIYFACGIHAEGMHASLQNMHESKALRLFIKANSTKMSAVPSEEKAKIQEVLSPFREQWITNREKKGFSRAKEALSLFTKAMTESNEKYGK